MIRWSGLSWSERAFLTGALAVGSGALAVLVAGGRNRNDVSGTAAVALVAAVVTVVAWSVARRPGSLADPASLVARPAGVTAAVVALLELAESASEGFATDHLGLLGLVGRVVAAAGAIALVSAALRGASRRLRPRGRVGLLALVGVVAIVAGWAALIVLGGGFALRPSDAVGIGAAIGAAMLLLVGGRQATLAAAALVAAVAVIGLDVLVTIAPDLGSVAESGAAHIVALAVYLLGVVAMIAGEALAARDLLPRRAAPGTATAA